MKIPAAGSTQTEFWLSLDGSIAFQEWKKTAGLFVGATAEDLAELAFKAGMRVNLPDASRYRWLTNDFDEAAYLFRQSDDVENLDAAIDQAIAKEIGQ